MIQRAGGAPRGAGGHPRMGHSYKEDQGVTHHTCNNQQLKPRGLVWWSHHLGFQAVLSFFSPSRVTRQCEGNCFQRITPGITSCTETVCVQKLSTEYSMCYYIDIQPFSFSYIMLLVTSQTSLVSLPGSSQNKPQRCLLFWETDNFIHSVSLTCGSN